jgi:hypothetical protein
VRASRWVVRPGSKRGTVVVFTSPKAALLQITVVRVFPRCKVMGTIRVRAHAGTNRIPFRGRVRGKPLPAGTYRLRLRFVGDEGDAAAVTIVVVRGKTSAKRLRAARRAAVCGDDPAAASLLPVSFRWPTGGSVSGGSNETSPAAPLAEAAKGVVKKAKSLTSRVKRSLQDSGPITPLFLTIVGLLTLASALLGAFVLIRVLRITELRDRFYR